MSGKNKIETNKSKTAKALENAIYDYVRDYIGTYKVNVDKINYTAGEINTDNVLNTVLSDIQHCRNLLPTFETLIPRSNPSFLEIRFMMRSLIKMFEITFKVKINSFEYNAFVSFKCEITPLPGFADLGFDDDESDESDEI